MIPSPTRRLLTITAVVLLAALPLAAQVPLEEPPANTYAGGCLVGPQLGATLLMPYFEASLVHSVDGEMSYIAIVNGLNQYVLARVVMWTDWGVPTLAWDVALAPFDTQSYGMFLPLGRPEVPDANDVVILRGNNVVPPAILNQWPGCGEFEFPPLTEANEVAFGNDIVEKLRALHSGKPVLIDGVTVKASHDYDDLPAYDDTVARGYITVDVVNQCSGVEFMPQKTPANPDVYFGIDGTGGIADTTNALWGDLYYIHGSANSAQGNEVVTIWADPEYEPFNRDRTYTFYGRYFNWDGRDKRVPLPNLWNQRYLDGVGEGEAGTYTTNIVVWRDTGSPESVPLASGEPSWFPLSGEFASVSEDATDYRDHGEYSANLATQRMQIGNLQPEAANLAGWLQFFSGDYGSWTIPVLDSKSIFSVSINGAPVGFLCGKVPPQ